MTATIRRTVKARDIPPSWQVELPEDPDAMVIVTIGSPGPPRESRRLTDFIGAGKGAYPTRAEADLSIRELREEWRR